MQKEASHIALTQKPNNNLIVRLQNVSVVASNPTYFGTQDYTHMHTHKR